MSKRLLLGAFAILCLVRAPYAKADPSFQQLSWFQITFCQDIRHLTFEPTTNAQTLPVFGFAGDNAVGGKLHYYRWELLSGQEVDHVEIATSDPTARAGLRQVTISPDGTKALLASDSLDVVLFDLVGHQVLKRFSGHRFETTLVAFSDDMSMIAAADVRNNIWIWQDSTPDMPFQLLRSPAAVQTLAFIDGGARLKVVGGKLEQTYNVQSGVQEGTRDLPLELGHDWFRSTDLVYAPDGSTFAASTAEVPHLALFKASDYTKLWEVDFGNIDAPPGWPAGPNDPWGIEFSRNGQCLVVGEWAGLRVLNPVDGAELWRQRLNAGSHSYLFSPDSRYMIAADGCDVEIYKVPPVCGGTP